MPLPTIFFTILGILCILYGIAVFLIRSGTLFYAVWLALGACSLLLGYLFRNQFFARLPKIVNAILLIALSAGLLLIIVCEGFVLRGFGNRAPQGLDYLIVLGAQVRSDGPSKVLKYRLDAAMDYLQENPGTLCIVTGGKGDGDSLTEGEGMRRYLVSRGLDPARILVEDKARNTTENIQLSKKLMTSPDAPTALVTNNFHVTRALALARKQGLTKVCAMAAPSEPFYLPNKMFREFFGLSKDYLLGNL